MIYMLLPQTEEDLMYPYVLLEHYSGPYQVTIQYDLKGDQCIENYYNPKSWTSIKKEILELMKFSPITYVLFMSGSVIE